MLTSVSRKFSFVYLRLPISMAHFGGYDDIGQLKSFLQGLCLKFIIHLTAVLCSDWIVPSEGSTTSFGHSWVGDSLGRGGELGSQFCAIETIGCSVGEIVYQHLKGSVMTLKLWGDEHRKETEGSKAPWLTAGHHWPGQSGPLQGRGLQPPLSSQGCAVAPASLNWLQLIDGLMDTVHSILQV